MKPGVLTLGAALLAFLILYGMTHPRVLVFDEHVPHISTPAPGHVQDHYLTDDLPNYR